MTDLVKKRSFPPLQPYFCLIDKSILKLLVHEKPGYKYKTEPFCFSEYLKFYKTPNFKQ